MNLEASTRYSVRQLAAPSPQRDAALEAIFGCGTDGQPRSGPGQRGEKSTVGPTVGDFVFGAFAEERLIAACAATTSPGGGAMAWLPAAGRMRPSWAATAACLSELLRLSRERGVRYVQALLEPDHREFAQALKQANFRYLARLLYQARAVVQKDTARTRTPALAWVSYGPKVERMFCEALSRTYAKTMDCPSFTSLRTPAEALATHRATGVHDPELWWVALRDTQPIGVMLLSRVPGASAVEVVYMGVAPEGRGTGVSDELMHRAIEAARRRGIERITLAVDSGNTPARRLYERFGFRTIAQRDAWIATSCGSEG